MTLLDEIASPVPSAAVRLPATRSVEPFAFEDVTPLDRYLAAQADLTAVGRFVHREAADLLPKQSRYYRDLIPLERPQTGQQYGFEVDLDTCTGCKSCVTACHSLNGLDDDESRRSVGLLHGASEPDEDFARELAVASDLAGAMGGAVGESLADAIRTRASARAVVATQQTVTTGCHHCVDPACLKGCPVDAYEKDLITGIVKHLDDQCIGCGYCTLTCPYEVPRYSASRGIVRKCDMCSDRLAVGEAPACVQACPNGAITIAIVVKADIVASSADTYLVPGAPRSAITAPTTVYRSTRPSLADMQPADRFQLRPAEAHPPLAVMLVLTQLSVGAFLTDLVLRFSIGRHTGATSGHDLAGALRPANALVALVLGLVALGASILHLGRPQHFYRAVIGFRHSWLSREIVAFGAFATLAAGYALALWKAPAISGLGAGAPGALVGVIGTIGVACSAKIYAVTARTWWRLHFTAVKFAGTMAICGLATVLVTSSIAALVIGGDVPAKAAHDVLHPLALGLVGVTLPKLLWELAFLTHLHDRGITDLKRTAMLLCGPLRVTTVARMIAGATGGIIVPLILAALAGRDDATPPVVGCAALAALALAFVISGELIERYQFFRAVSSPRMPGYLA